MSKPVWEDETWRADDLLVLGTHEHCDDYPVAEISGTALGPERAKLAAAAPEMARMLFMWARCGHEWECPSCERDLFTKEGDPADFPPLRVEAHEPDCRLIAMLRKAGVIAS